MGKVKDHDLFCTDIETTGLDAKKHEAFEIDFSIESGGVVYCDMCLYLRPENVNSIDQKALDVNGWTVERLMQLPDRSGQIDKLAAFLDTGSFRSDKTMDKMTIVEYGNGLDKRFLRATLGDNLFDRYFYKDSINVLSMAKKYLPKIKSYSLESIAKYLAVDVNDNMLHGASYDRRLMMAVYKAIIEWRNGMIRLTHNIR